MQKSQPTSMICVSITETNPSNIIALANSSEMAEIRIDLCQLDKRTVASVFQSIHVPTIATCRPQYADDTMRALLLKQAIVSGATYVDVEIESTQSFKQDIIAFAHNHSCKSIISYHNYDNTPNVSELRKIIQQCFNEQADIAKIATTALSEKDAATVLSLYADFNNIVALAMGSYGKITRIANLYLGSPFSFAAKDEQHATAKGQFTVAEMQRLQKILEVKD